jgi:hypothetical protein
LATTRKVTKMAENVSVAVIDNAEGDKNTLKRDRSRQ